MVEAVTRLARRPVSARYRITPAVSQLVTSAECILGATPNMYCSGQVASWPTACGTGLITHARTHARAHAHTHARTLRSLGPICRHSYNKRLTREADMAQTCMLNENQLMDGYVTRKKPTCQPDAIDVAR